MSSPSFDPHFVSALQALQKVSEEKGHHLGKVGLLKQAQSDLTSITGPFLPSPGQLPSDGTQAQTLLTGSLTANHIYSYDYTFVRGSQESYSSGGGWEFNMISGARGVRMSVSGLPPYIDHVNIYRGEGTNPGNISAQKFIHSIPSNGATVATWDDDGSLTPDTNRSKPDAWSDHLFQWANDAFDLLRQATSEVSAALTDHTAGGGVEYSHVDAAIALMLQAKQVQIAENE